MDTQATQLRPSRPTVLGSVSTLGAALPFLALLVVGVLFPLFGGGYWGVIATRACVYWVLVSGLNLVVGFAGQIAIGWVALLTLGAYTTSVLAAGNVMPALPPYLALAIAAVVGAIFGLIIGLPALRLRTFYFAITTLGFATIVTQVALAWQSVTGGGVGVAGPIFPEPFASQWGFYYFCFGLAAICTWTTANIAASRFGRALTAIRDAEVAAEASGIAKPALLGAVFLFSGAVAAVAGGLFAALQSYITPDAFTLDLSVLFFIAILIGGRGSILGPLLGTILLTVLPEFAAPLVAWSTFLYAALLLVIVLVIPGGIAELLDFKNRRPLESDRAIIPRPDLLDRLLGTTPNAGALTLQQVALSFGGVQAIDGLDLEIRPGQVHGLIGPNGSGKTTTLNVISGYYAPQRGAVRLNDAAMPVLARHQRARMRIARTFQTPRIVGSASVLQNVMIGGTIDGEGTFVESLLSLPRHRRDEAMLRDTAMLALAAVGLERLAQVRADRLQHSELRFTEIARALMLRPAFLLLDEPAAGLSAEEIARLSALLLAIARAGTGVLLVEHHPDLIFDICHYVTVLNLGMPISEPDPLLDVAGLSSGYGKIGVLRGVDLNVGAGEVVALLGPNGAGKTTLLRAVSGLLPWSGSVRFAGRDLAGFSPRETVRCGLAHVVEGHRVFTQLSVLDNLLLAAYDLPRGERAVRVEEVFGLFPEIAAKRHERAAALSGGQQQILAVAQGLVRRPRLLMLDEPSAGLSPVLVDRVLVVVQRLREAGTAVLLVEQLIEKALALADRVYALARGSIVLEAKTGEADLPLRLQHAYMATGSFHT